jgi:hypothetical protein
MTCICVTFRKCLQDSQDLGSTDEHMVSRLFFNLKVNGLEYTGFHCNIKQIVGAQYESDSPLEIDLPTGTSYHGPFNYEAFRMEAERYYRESFGSQGHGIRIEHGAKNVRMRNNIVVREKVVEFEASGPDAAW